MWWRGRWSWRRIFSPMSSSTEWRAAVRVGEVMGEGEGEVDDNSEGEGERDSAELSGDNSGEEHSGSEDEDRTSNE